MNEHCRLCDQPRKPRHDRPGCFFTLCKNHYAEYQRQKNKESYARHSQRRKAERKERYWNDPDKSREIAKRSSSRPEAIVRKRLYMETYRRPWRIHVKLVCEKCGFVAQEKKQMDVHHIDGDRSNNDQSNLQTLCPPCHRMIPPISSLAA